MKDAIVYTITVSAEKQTSTVKASDPDKVNLVNLVAATESMCHLVAEGIRDLSSEESYDVDLENFIVATLVRAITGASSKALLPQETKTYTLEEVIEE